MTPPEKTVIVVEDKPKYVENYRNSLPTNPTIIQISSVPEFQDQVQKIIEFPPDLILIDLFLDSFDRYALPEENTKRYWTLRKRTFRQLIGAAPLLKHVDHSIGGNGLQIIEIIKDTLEKDSGLTDLNEQYHRDKLNSNTIEQCACIIRNHREQTKALKNKVNKQFTDFMQNCGAFSSFRVLGKNVGNLVLEKAGTNPALSIDKR